MSAQKITLTVTGGWLPEKEYAFEAPTRCVIGRAPDCDLQVPSDPTHADISRHHCLLEIEPQAVRVRDLGSRNGTWVNGTRIGQRSVPEAPPEKADRDEGAKYPLKDGDEIKVGHTCLRVGISGLAEIPPIPLQFV